jgi:hypothetical protein
VPGRHDPEAILAERPHLDGQAFDPQEALPERTGDVHRRQVASLPVASAHASDRRRGSGASALRREPEVGGGATAEDKPSSGGHATAPMQTPWAISA